METTEKVGDVLRTPLGALKRICEENSMTRVIGDLLPRFERIVDTKMSEKEQKPLFTQNTRDQYLGEEMLEDLKNQDGYEIGE